MQRNTPQTPRNPRHAAERDATQAMGGQPRADDEDDELQDPDRVPSFLTARELEARGNAKTPAPGNEGTPGERQGRIMRPGGADEDEA